MHNVNWDSLSTIKGAQRANGHTNCPNCGAPIDGEKCAYCGTVFLDVSCIDIEAPCYLKIKIPNRNGGPDDIMLLRAKLRSAEYSATKIAPFSTLRVLPSSQELVLTFDILKGEVL